VIQLALRSFFEFYIIQAAQRDRGIIEAFDAVDGGMPQFFFERNPSDTEDFADF
jgi:hypothetical protein